MIFRSLSLVGARVTRRDDGFLTDVVRWFRVRLPCNFMYSINLDMHKMKDLVIILTTPTNMRNTAGWLGRFGGIAITYIY